MTDEMNLRDLSETKIVQLRALLERRGQGPFVDLDEAEADTLAMLERKRKACGL